MKPGLVDFIRAFGSRWFVLMSGPASVPLAIAAYFVPNGVARSLLALTASACVFFSCYWVWRVEREARIEGLSKIGRYERDARSLEIIFDDRDGRCVRDESDFYGGVRVRRWWGRREERISCEEH